MDGIPPQRGRYFIRPIVVSRRAFPCSLYSRSAQKLRRQWIVRLRITTRHSGAVTVVQVDGELRKQGVPELEKVCRSISGPCCLDLANLQSIDAEGIRAIHGLETGGAAVAGVTPYIQRLLHPAADD